VYQIPLCASKSISYALPEMPPQQPQDEKWNPPEPNRTQKARPLVAAPTTPRRKVDPTGAHIPQEPLPRPVAPWDEAPPASTKCPVPRKIFRRIS
jgi:hypothetical protein